MERMPFWGNAFFSLVALTFWLKLGYGCFVVRDPSSPQERKGLLRRGASLSESEFPGVSFLIWKSVSLFFCGVWIFFGVKSQKIFFFGFSLSLALFSTLPSLDNADDPFDNAATSEVLSLVSRVLSYKNGLARQSGPHHLNHFAVPLYSYYHD
jgi:hypothetical protein